MNNIASMADKKKLDRKARGYFFRNLIIDALKEKGLSSYWLAERVARQGGSITPDGVYRYLRGDTDSSGEHIAQYLTALGFDLDTMKMKQSDVVSSD